MHDLVTELIGRVKGALVSGDRERLFDTGLDRCAAKALRRARSNRTLCRVVFETLAVLHRERSRALGGDESALHHDLGLLFGHSRYAARPLDVLREADVLRGGRHRPGARRRLGDRRPFTQYLTGRRQLVELRRGVPGDDVLRDARTLSEQLHDPVLRSDVDDFLRSLGTQPPARPAPAHPAAARTPATPDTAGTPAAPAGPVGPAAVSTTPSTERMAARASLSREQRALREAGRHEDRFHRTKDPDDLDLALRAMGEAGEYAARSGARLRALSWGMETGRLYAVRFGLLGGWEDQLHAVASMRMVIAQLPPGHPALVGDLLQLGVTLEGGHEYMFDTYGPRCGTEVIDEAVAALRRAWLMVEAGVVPPEDEDLPGTVLTMLGHCLLKRALAQREADAGDRDLDEAVRLLDRATALLGDGGDGPDRMLAGGRGTPGRAQVASLLRMYRVQAGLLRAMADGDLTALKEVIATARRRLETAGSPEARPQWQVILGGAQVFADLLAGRAAPDPPEPAPPGGDRGVAAAGGTPPPGTGDPSAAAMLAEAARGGTGSEGPRRALRYARLAATVALRQHRWAEAAELLGEALRQIHAQPSYGIPESARRAWLGQGRDVAGDLVTCLVSLGRTQEAVVAFEEHRAVLLSEVLGERADTVGLERVAPGPARDHRAAVRELRRFDTGDDARRPQHLAGRRRLIEERERVAERIRRIEGFERFGRPPRFADLVTDGHGGAAEGPVVLVNTGSLRSDALLLQDGEVRVVALPEARGDRLESATGALHRALNAAEEARADGDGPAYLRQQRAVGEVLEQLWDRVAAPVWEQVGAGWAPGDPPRRIWWVPSGPLWFLPLHTASAPGGPSLADLAVSSYVPTVRMLHLGRRRAPGRLHGPLVIGVPDAPGAAPLPGAEAEARLVASLTPGARLLTGPAATREAVLGALGRHRWLHFAGHGINTDDGTLLLLDGAGGQSLTTRDVLGRDLPGGDLAYLSACEAAQTSVLLPDEATHFGAALSVAGYRHVIGTLWRVDDGVAAEAARRFYGHLAPTATGTGTGTGTDIGIGTGTGPGTTTDARTGAGARSGADPALALHLTVRELRAAYPSMPGLWAAHLHIGP